MTRLRGAGWLAAGLCLAGSTLPALAQTPVQPQPPAPNMPAPQATPPEKVEPGPTLSDKLERTDGVIRPPANVDPGIVTRAPVPSPNSTPVIPPPGSPGGNPTLDPK